MPRAPRPRCPRPLRHRCAGADTRTCESERYEYGDPENPEIPECHGSFTERDHRRVVDELGSRGADRPVSEMRAYERRLRELRADRAGRCRTGTWMFLVTYVTDAWRPFGQCRARRRPPR